MRLRAQGSHTTTAASWHWQQAPARLAAAAIPGAAHVLAPAVLQLRGGVQHCTLLLLDCCPSAAATVAAAEPWQPAGWRPDWQLCGSLTWSHLECAAHDLHLIILPDGHGPHLQQQQQRTRTQPAASTSVHAHTVGSPLSCLAESRLLDTNIRCWERVKACWHLEHSAALCCL